MIVIGQRVELKIGEVVRKSFAGVNQECIEQPYQVIGISTFEEWKRCYFELGGKKEILEAWLFRNTPYPYYYQIHTD